MDVTEQLVLVMAGISLTMIVGALLAIARRDRRLAEGRTSAASTIPGERPMLASPAINASPATPSIDASPATPAIPATPAGAGGFERPGLTPARARRFLTGRRAGS